MEKSHVVMADKKMIVIVFFTDGVGSIVSILDSGGNTLMED